MVIFEGYRLFVVFVLLWNFHEAIEVDRKKHDNPICDPRHVLDANHLIQFPTVQRIQNLPAIKIDDFYNFCGLPKGISCCDEPTLLHLKRAFIQLDYASQKNQKFLKQIWNNENDFVILVDNFLQSTLNLKKLDTNLVKALHQGFTVEHTREIADLFSFALSLWNDLLGYFSSLACSVCDVRSTDYLQAVSTTDNKGYHLEIRLPNTFQRYIGEKFGKLLRKIQDVLQTEHVGNVIKAVVQDLCKLEAITSLNKEKFEACESKSWLNEMYLALTEKVLEKDQLLKLFCEDPNAPSNKSKTDAAQLCTEMFSTKGLSGMSIDFNAFRDRVVENLLRKDKEYCPEKFIDCKVVSNYLKGVEFNAMDTNHQPQASSFPIVVNKYVDKSSKVKYFDLFRYKKNGKGLSQEAFKSVSSSKFAVHKFAVHNLGSINLSFFKAPAYLGMGLGLVYAGKKVYKVYKDNRFDLNEYSVLHR